MGEKSSKGIRFIKSIVILFLIFSYSCSMALVENVSKETTSSKSNTARAVSNGFTISGTKLYDANDNLFEMRGINHAHAWYKGEEETVIPAIAKTGANTIRIALGTGNQWDKDDAETVSNLINLAKENEMIAVLEVHDATGSDNLTDLQDAVDYWIEIKDVLIGQEAYVIINIANEWYGTWGSSSWADGYISQIPRLREAGLTHTLIVDAAGWGQYPASIVDKGENVLNADSLGNTMFSIHMYEYAGGTATQIETNIDNVLNKNLALVIGEFGIRHTNGDVDEAAIMRYSEEMGVSWLAWSWYGNTEGTFDYLDLSSDWAGSSYTEWGSIAVNGDNGLKDTAIKCSVFTDGVVVEEPVTEFIYAVIDDYSSTSSGDFSVNSNGNSITPTIVSGALQLDYTLGSPSYAGLSKSVTINGYDSSYDTLSFDLVGDNSTRDLIIQFRESDGEYFEASVVIKGTEYISIPVSNFSHPTWYSGGDNVLDFSSVSQYSFYIQNGNSGTSSIQIDNLTVGTKSLIIDDEGDEGVDDKPVIVDGAISIEYTNDNSVDSTKALKPKLRIINNSDSSIDLADLTIQYWYTDETEVNQLATIYWASVSTSTVTSTFIEGDISDCMQFSFTSGTLNAGSSIDLNLGINATNWGYYTQSNDYSFASTSSYTENSKISAFIGTTLAWGSTPDGSGGGEEDPDETSVTAEFIYSPSIVEFGDTVTFDAGTSTVTNSTILSYEWDIDGSQFSGETVSYTFTEMGSYSVTLTVTNADGDVDFIVKKPYIIDPDAEIDYGAATGEDVGVVWASWNPDHFSGTSYTHFMGKIDSYGIKRVTLIPTYFIDTYSEGIRYQDWVNTPDIQTQIDLVLDLLIKGVRVNFRPHIDPLLFSWEGASSTTANPGALGWRGVFDQLDPMNDAHNYKEVMINSLDVLSAVVTSDDMPELKEPIRFDLGAELMESTKKFAQSWVEISEFVRTEIDTNYPELIGKIILGHNFCHHIEYSKSIENHEDDYFARILSDGDVAGNQDLFFVDDMDSSNKIALAEYIKGLDTFSVSQYMPMDVFGTIGSITPENVRDSLLLHEKNFLEVIIQGELGISPIDMPAFQIGEYGMGIRGLAAPNVWDRASWVADGAEDKLISYDEHQIHAQTAIEGLLLYMEDSSSVANSFQIWMSGAPYDVLTLNPTFSVGDAGHGYSGMESFNQGASDALTEYWAK